MKKEGLQKGRGHPWGLLSPTPTPSYPQPQHQSGKTKISKLLELDLDPYIVFAHREFGLNTDILHLGETV